jgi:hypothetical protein
MTFSQMQLFADVLAGHTGPEIPAPTRAYFEQRLRNRLFKFLVEKFADAQKDGLTQATLARRLGRTPDVVNRWLSSPSNLTSDTICDLLLGIAGEELEPHSSSPMWQTPHNYSHFVELSFGNYDRNTQNKFDIKKLLGEETLS